MPRTRRCPWAFSPTRRNVRLPAFGIVAASLSLVPSRAHAATDKTFCHGPKIVMSESVQEPWRTAVENARAQLSETSDIDRCAELLLESNGGGLRVQISLADGRAAVRDLSDPSQVEATLRALLSVPTVDSTKGQSPPTVRVIQPVLGDLHNRATGASQPHLELGIGAMARIARV